MTIIDYVDLCDDEEIIVEEPGPHGQVHAADMHVELVDLTTEGDGVEDQNIPGKDDAVLCTTLHSPNFIAAHGQGETAHRIVTLCKQGFIAVVDDAEEAMQSGNRELSAANDGKGEAMQSADQGIVVAGDCTEDVMMSGNQDFASAVADAEETMQSGTQEFVAEGDHSRDAMQFGNAGQASTCSSMSEQGAITYSSMTEQIATASSSMTGQWSREAAAFLCSRPMSIALPFPRQFWKAGEYSVAAQPTINSMLFTFLFRPSSLYLIVLPTAINVTSFRTLSAGGFLFPVFHCLLHLTRPHHWQGKNCKRTIDSFI